MISTKELNVFKAQEEFERMCEFLEQALSEGRRVDEVERGLVSAGHDNVPGVVAVLC